MAIEMLFIFVQNSFTFVDSLKQSNPNLGILLYNYKRHIAFYVYNDLVVQDLKAMESWQNHHII